MGRRKKVYNCDFWSDVTLPPCAEFLGNYNPLKKNGIEVFRNYNRIYWFLSFSEQLNTQPKYNPCDPNTFTNSALGNIQISFHDFLIGLFINLVQKGDIDLNACGKIHEDDKVDNFIKETLKVKEEEVIQVFVPSLIYTISNSNAILSLYTANFTISKTNFYILLMLNRLEGDPALLFGNNSYATPDIINYELSTLFIPK